MRKLDDWMDSYMTIMKDTEPTERYKRWCGIGGIASVMQRKTRVITHESHGPLFPNMYIILVGPPGCGKNAAIAPVSKMVEKMPNIQIGLQIQSKEYLLQALDEARTIYRDENGEDTHQCAMMVYAEEIMILLQNGDVDTLTWFNRVYDGGRIDHGTFARGRDAPTNVCFTFIGGTTPGAMAGAFPSEANTGGFISRCSFIYAPGKGKHAPFQHFTKTEHKILGQLEEDLLEIHALVGEFQMDTWVKKAYTYWYDKKVNNVSFGSHQWLDNYTPRRNINLCKLMMVSSASRGNSLEITREDFERGLDWMEESELDMPKCFSGGRAQSLVEVRAGIIKFISSRESVSGYATHKEILHAFVMVTNKKCVEDALEEFVIAGLLRQVAQAAGNKKMPSYVMGQKGKAIIAKHRKGGKS